MPHDNALLTGISHGRWFNMKIELNGGYGVYGKKSVSENAKTADSRPESAKKTADSSDVVDISRGSTTISDKSFLSLKANLQSDINQSASAERLEQLRADIKSGSYRIPTEALVDSILGD